MIKNAERDKLHWVGLGRLRGWTGLSAVQRTPRRDKIFHIKLYIRSWRFLGQCGRGVRGFRCDASHVEHRDRRSGTKRCREGLQIILRYRVFFKANHYGHASF